MYVCARKLIQTNSVQVDGKQWEDLLLLKDFDLANSIDYAAVSPHAHTSIILYQLATQPQPHLMKDWQTGLPE